jgi:hypothetical protein
VARLVLVDDKRKASTQESSTVSGSISYAGATTEGEAARQLLEANGYLPRRVEAQNGQYEFNCPFHEDPGKPDRGRSTNFYVDRKTSKYTCHSASCGERGNLQTLERFFGVDADPAAKEKYRSLKMRLQQWRSAMSEERRQVFHDAGLTDHTIDRFKIGFDEDNKYGPCYVIPYLDAGHVVGIRYYSPEGKGPNGSKYWWEPGTEAILYNAASGCGDEKGRVFVAEGEKKAMLLEQWGYFSTAVPGADQWKREWTHHFNHAREIILVYDNDNPLHHIRPIDKCHKCRNRALEECEGHNPGQEAALRRKEELGFRAHNVVLPLPSDDLRKTDINDYVMRDKKSKSDFEILLLGGDKASPFLIRTLGEIFNAPPSETHFLVSDGVLPKGGRLLISGAPKVGKSIFVENLALALASGIPFLGRFQIADINTTPGIRTMLLDREVSERSLYDRLKMLIDHKPGFMAAQDNLFIDHKFRLTLDTERAEEDMCNLIFANGAQVVILDTAYKFFQGDMNNQASVNKMFSTLDRVIERTGVSIILTHHHRKGTISGQNGGPNADQVVGSFLWTGWPNGTVLLNFKERRVDQPFNTICSFVAFRDAAPPEPLVLFRGRDTIAYTAIENWTQEDEESSNDFHVVREKLSVESLANTLIQAAPITRDSFLHMAAGRFGCREETVRPVLAQVMADYPDFTQSGQGNTRDPFILKYRPDHLGEEPSEIEMVSARTKIAVGFDDVDMFDPAHDAVDKTTGVIE